MPVKFNSAGDFDLAQCGVGTAACGPGPLPPYLLTARPVAGSLTFTAIPTTEERR